MRRWFDVLATALLVASLPFASHAVVDIEHWTTGNGARVYFVAAPEIPIVDIRFVFNAGSARDGDAAGIARVTAKLLGEGAGEFDANAFSERIADTGAELSSSALRDMAWVSLRSLAERKYLEPSLDLMRAVLTAPRFDVDAVERIKARTLVDIRQEQQSPSAIASKAFFRAVYGNHPYASPLPGTEESVTAMTRDMITAFHARYYVANNVTVAIVGALDRAEAEQIAERLTNGMHPGEAAPELIPVAPVDGAIERRVDFPSIQSHVRIGQPGMKRGDPDYFPLLVGNHVLGGGGLVSILFDEVREKRGLSYSVNSYFTPMAELGPFTASLQTDHSQEQQAIAVLRAEIEKFVREGPDAAALEAAKSNLIGGFPLRIDSNSKIVEYLSMIGFYGLPLDYLGTFTERVSAVTVETVKSAFQRRLHPERMITVVVGRSAEASDG